MLVITKYPVLKFHMTDNNVVRSTRGENKFLHIDHYIRVRDCRLQQWTGSAHIGIRTDSRVHKSNTANGTPSGEKILHKLYLIKEFKGSNP